MSIRSILKVVPARSLIEGTGVHVNRGLAIHQMHNFNPFLLIDHFKGKVGEGFPFHPHGGMQTITYMIKGHMMHEDFTGSRGIVGPGDLQIMTAGKGIAHQEIPIGRLRDDSVEGIQLWVALPELFLKTDPGHEIVAASKTRSVKAVDSYVNILSGLAMGALVKTDLAKANIELYHYIIAPRAQFEIPAREDWNWFLYVMLGNGLNIDNQAVEANTSVFFNRDGDHIVGRNKANTKLDFFVAAGEILDQPIKTIYLFSGPDVKEIQKNMAEFKAHSGPFEKFGTYVPKSTEELADELVPWKQRGWVEKKATNAVEFGD